jgi:hypothetical protein
MEEQVRVLEQARASAQDQVVYLRCEREALWRDYGYLMAAVERERRPIRDRIQRRVRRFKTGKLK